MSKYKTAKPGFMNVLTFNVKRHGLCALNSMKCSSFKYHNNNPVFSPNPVQIMGKNSNIDTVLSRFEAYW